MLKRLSLSFVVSLALVVSAAAQPAPAVQAAVALFQQVRTVPNVVYVRANGWEGKLDIYAQRARNAEIWDVEARRYVDFASGIAVLNTGHLHPRVVAAVEQQLQESAALAMRRPGRRRRRWRRCSAKSPG